MGMLPNNDHLMLDKLLQYNQLGRADIVRRVVTATMLMPHRDTPSC
jgi:hypothetical protein